MSDSPGNRTKPELILLANFLLLQNRVVLLIVFFVLWHFLLLLNTIVDLPGKVHDSALDQQRGSSLILSRQVCRGIREYCDEQEMSLRDDSGLGRCARAIRLQFG